MPVGKKCLKLPPPSPFPAPPPPTSTPTLPRAFGFDVFDVIVSLLQRLGGKAKKGSGRNHRVGHEKCSGDTVVGAIALEYLGKQEGDSVIDPVFVLAAVLDWAGIAANELGRIRLLP